RPRRAHWSLPGARPVPDGGLERRPRADGDPRAGACRPDRRAGDRKARRRRGALVARQPGAGGDDRAASGRAARRTGSRPTRPRACRRVDRNRLAGDDGERRALRPRRGSRTVGRRDNQGGRMTVTQELNALDTGVEGAAERLLSLQHPDGWWKGELESNATMIAEHLFLLHFLGLRDPETDRLLANELLARRRADGTWSIWFEGPPDLSVTVEAYAAVKLAGVDAGDETQRYICRAGGIPKTRIFTRAFLALIGQWPWRRLAHVPVELILLPAQGPLSVYDFACWARQTMVALSVVEALRPVRPSPIDLSEIGGGRARPGPPARPPPPRRPARAGRARRWCGRSGGDG